MDWWRMSRAVRATRLLSSTCRDGKCGRSSMPGGVQMVWPGSGNTHPWETQGDSSDGPSAAKTRAYIGRADSHGQTDFSKAEHLTTQFPFCYTFGKHLRH